MKCKVEGCERECMYQAQQVCQKHYFRFMRYGTYDLTMKPRKKRRSHSAGYICLFIPEHPLANSNGEVYEHRFVVYEKYGNEIPPCELCGAATSWHPYTTHIDHINKIKHDNRPENLRVLCNACNSQRDLNAADRRGVFVIEIGGVKKTAYQWAAVDGANHSGSSIKRRFLSGLGAYESVFGKNKTHPKQARAAEANG